MILEIISGIHRFLGYLDISMKYLNRAYTIVGIFPTLYILRIVYGLFEHENYLQFTLYLFIFIILTYFIILNIFYYFFDKNVKWDVTQLFVKYLPDEVFNIENTNEVEKDLVEKLNGEELKINYVPDYNVLLTKNINNLIKSNNILINDLEQGDLYQIPRNTLYPFYNIERTNNNYLVKVGSNYENMFVIGTIETTEDIKTLGLFIRGGLFKKDGVTYKEVYQLQLIAEKKESIIEIPTENNENHNISRLDKYHKNKKTS